MKPIFTLFLVLYQINDYRLTSADSTGLKNDLRAVAASLFSEGNLFDFSWIDSSPFDLRQFQKSLDRESGE